MTKSELVQRLGEKYPNYTNAEVEKGVKIILDQICEALVEGRRIEVRGFGRFSVRYRAPKTGRNPKTGDSVKLSCKYASHFKAGKHLRESVNESRHDFDIQ